MSNMFPSGYEELVENSYLVRLEIETNGAPTTYVPYIPINDSPDTGNLQKELLDGLKMKNGKCPSCFMVKTASGACNC